MKKPNATRNDFSTRIIQRDVSFQVSFNFLNDEDQTKAHMATLGQVMKNLRSKLQEHRVNAVEESSRAVDPNQKRKTECYTFLQLLPHKRTYSKLMPQEDTGRRTETNQKRKNCPEESHLHPKL